MGKLFLTFIGLFCLLAPSVGWGEVEIQLIPPPQVILAPPPSENLQQGLERKRRQRRAREQGPANGTSPSERRNKKLALEVHKERPYIIMGQVSLVLPGIKTQGLRRDYTTELTSHFSLFIRPQPSKESTTLQVWTGIRLAPFAGTGTYQTTPGRYGFLYFGPMLGLGKINPLEEAAEQEPFARRTGWFIMAGIAAHSRNGVTEASNEPVNHDLNTVRGVKLDGLGLWVEATYSVIHFGALGTNYVAGLQIGEGKIFYWLGLAAGAWY